MAGYKAIPDENLIEIHLYISTVLAIGYDRRHLQLELDCETQKEVHPHVP